MSTPIVFIDLAAQQRVLGTRIHDAIARVLAHGGYILGKEVGEFEKALCSFTGATHAIGCANGTDAITLSLMAEGVGPGDVVFAPSFTFVATAESVCLVGATPCFVDVRADSFNIDPESLEAAIADTKAKGGKPRAIIAVDLFGLPADYAALAEIASRHSLLLIADSAQGFGGEIDGRRSGTFADYTTTSFFPAKPLGCYGDGGAVLTDDPDRAARLRSIRVHGKGTDKYDNVRIGLNSRLDTIQAAILIEKLAIFADELDRRDAVAARYEAGLADVVATPKVPAGWRSSWAQYTLTLPGERDRVAKVLGSAGIPSQVYYATPLHLQTAYRHHPITPGGLPVSERLASEVLSLPFHPYLERDDQDRIIAAIQEALAATKGAAGVPRPVAQAS